ncbi:ATP synthase F1 subcomplex epsilon subunit [Prochlorococcus marinus str. NATL2A]|uniref:ATP synthase epsilon chain n=1 Tax=Prochlorococcus marinus (strain NATL2A) TaxID=59920 RepID=ATPE_PROMT|nr:ATP synthase F1 subunit epsilon [Prochlorococcus marinus]Q46J67.1 RecName: Full=ATP synthase epsilon chain; AltName: Full=ATP synthase F1 sector epsilon subunit; AltName: Full=F-ATPase epsilon subunit [Prochlorococcus marinus str. NATL2A]AAZ58461.1 ATP synthase F1 subcomplex epsilon subunit [Prochlorococcus marinus str. NATL2A]
MTLTLRVLAPDQSVFDDTADEIILPSTTGLLGVLPGHISMVTAIDFGVLRVLKNGNWDSIALTGGFAEVESNEVTVLVNKAEMGKNIDSGKAEAELEKAKNQLSQNKDQGNSPEKIKAQETLNKAKAWFQASKSD